MSQALRTQISKAKRIVVKVGSSSLTTAEGGIDTQLLLDYPHWV